MILLPIGRDESEIRRHAWVSYTIIAFNILAFIATAVAMRHADEGPATEKYQETVNYLADHPWLTAPQPLEPYLDAKTKAEIEQLRGIAAMARSIPEPREKRREQERLNRMSDELQVMITDLSPQNRWGYTPAHPTFLTLLTSMFMHGGFLHLLGNLFFFFASGPFVEDVFGRPGFVFLYLSGGIVAAWAHAWQNPGSMIPLVGASGAIAAVMGAYLVRFFTAKVEFLFIPFLIRPTLSFRFFLPAFVVLPLWFLWQFWDATHGAGAAGVAVWAHVGGFAYGAALAGLVRVTDFETKFINPHIEGQTMWKQNEHLVRASEARARWDFETARRELRTLLQQEPNNIDALRVWYDVAVQSQDEQEFREAASRLLDTMVRMNEREMIIELLREVSALGFPMSEKYYARAAQYLDRAGERDWALDYYKELFERYPGSPSAVRALMQSARIFRQMKRPDLAKVALHNARRHPSCTSEWQQTINAQLAELEGAAGTIGLR